MSIGERFATRNEVEQLRRKLDSVISGKSGIGATGTITYPVTFTKLSDCPATYVATAGFVVRVKADETGLEFVDDLGFIENQFRYYADLANDAIYTLPFSVTSSARGFIAAGNNEERSDFWIDNDGDVTLINNSANVVANANTDDKLDIGTAAAQDPLQIKNRLGSTKKIFMIIWYN
jgi:hypothetical protein